MKSPRRFGSQLREIIKDFATGEVLIGSVIILVIIALFFGLR